ncbi:MAG: hypothetical protein IPJ19_16125 [Planctomycetes bacterium]|nr:hypothetical protein [Planctomycetota bacterium]
MKIPVLLLALCAAGCGSKAPESAGASAPVRVIRSMQISEKETSHLGFESKHAKGSIAIAVGVRIDYTSTTTNGSTRQLLTLDGKALEFEGPELLIGGKSFGKLAGEVAVVIEPGSVTVNGEKRGEL